MRYLAGGMNVLLFTFLAVILSELGGRDQLTVAALAHKQGRRFGVLAVALSTSVLTIILAASTANALAPFLIDEAQALLAMVALGLAGAEVLLRRRPPMPQEPTLSLGATAIVLIVQQLTDSARLLVFAMALVDLSPLPVALAGATGAIAVLSAAWAAPDIVNGGSLRFTRRPAGLGLLVLASLLALGFFG